MPFPQPRGDEGSDGQPARLGGGVAEERLRRRVPEDDPVGVGVGDDHRLPDRPEEPPDAELLGCLRRRHPPVPLRVVAIPAGGGPIIGPREAEVARGGAGGPPPHGACWLRRVGRVGV